MVIVLDNAPTHIANKIKALESFVNLFWLPPYSPHLNFIERVFALWKAHIKKKSYEPHCGNSKSIVKEALELVTLDSWRKKCIEQFEVYFMLMNNEYFSSDEGYVNKLQREV